MWTDAQYRTSSEHCKSKWGTALHLLEWQKSETLTPNAGKDMGQKELSFIADETVT